MFSGLESPMHLLVVLVIAVLVLGPKKLPDAAPCAAPPYPSLAPSTNATPASATFVTTVIGSVIPPQRVRDASASFVVVTVVQGGAKEGDVVPIPVASESLVGVIASLEP